MGKACYNETAIADRANDRACPLFHLKESIGVYIRLSIENVAVRFFYKQGCVSCQKPDPIRVKLSLKARLK